MENSSIKDKRYASLRSLDNVNQFGNLFELKRNKIKNFAVILPCKCLQRNLWLSHVGILPHYLVVLQIVAFCALEELVLIF
jgi:hypothetical protein